MGKRGKVLVVILAFMGLVVGLQGQAWAQALSTTPEVPTVRGETPAFTVKGFEFTLGNFIATDFLWDSTNVGGFEGAGFNIAPRGPVESSPGAGDGVPATTVDRARDSNLVFGATQTQIGFGIKGPGLWGGFTRAYFEWDFMGADQTGATNTGPTSNIGLRGRHLYWELGWPHSVTGFGDVSILVGQTVPLFVILIPETTEDIVLLGDGAIFGREPLAQVTTTIPLGPGNNLFIGASVNNPNSNLFGNLAPGRFTANFGTIAEATSSGVPYINGTIKYRNDFLGKANYWGGLVPFELAVAGFWGREELRITQNPITATGPNVSKSPWAVAGSLILPIIGTRTEKRAGILSIKGAGWYAENGNAYFLNGFQGIVQSPGQDGTLDTADDQFFNAKGAGGAFWVQWNPLENLMVYSIFSGSWTNSFPVGSRVVEGPNTQLQRTRAIEGGFLWNLNAALSAGFEVRYIEATFQNTRLADSNGFGGRGEDFRFSLNTTYAF